MTIKQIVSMNVNLFQVRHLLPLKQSAQPNQTQYCSQASLAKLVARWLLVPEFQV